MQSRQRKFSAGRRNGSKILHGCMICGTSTYLSPFVTHNGGNFCVCGETMRQMTKKESRGVL
jgi:hypothetical protein